MKTKRYEKIESTVLKAYARKYPEWTRSYVTQINENRVLDTIVGVSSAQQPDGELCIFSRGSVHIFDSTQELVRYLDSKAANIVTLKEVLVALIVVAMLFIYARIAFASPDPKTIALIATSISGILGAFVGAQAAAKYKNR